MADLQSLQTELKAAKEKWEDYTKLGKAKKEAENFPFPVWVSVAVQQPANAKAFDVYEIPIKLMVDGLEPGQKRVEVTTPEIPPQLQTQIADEVLKAWTSNCGKKAPWGISATFEWVEKNYVKLLMLDNECLHPYEGADENDCTIRRYAIGPPAVPVEEEEEEEEEEDEDEAAQAELAFRIQQLLAECNEGGGKKKLSEEEIERKRAEAAEMGEKARQLSKKERDELNKSRKERAGQRMAKTGQAHRKFDGEGAASKEDKKKKNAQNVAKRFGLS
eukprot:TRINITY_DN11963_c0_g1_i1.p1 TRINITY_DN11963_c0_g1~~TRINITY_DN11963_c0_g1_i1.p1  ORF type:complete len:275 (-),score=108.29 TRINITY_DN11963_c0_g1_i1:225-1049(-)